MTLFVCFAPNHMTPHTHTDCTERLPARFRHWPPRKHSLSPGRQQWHDDNDNQNNNNINNNINCIGSSSSFVPDCYCPAIVICQQLVIHLLTSLFFYLFSTDVHTGKHSRHAAELPRDAAAVQQALHELLRRALPRADLLQLEQSAVADQRPQQLLRLLECQQLPARIGHGQSPLLCHASQPALRRRSNQHHQKLAVKGCAAHSVHRCAEVEIGRTV